MSTVTTNSVANSPPAQAIQSAISRQQSGQRVAEERNVPAASSSAQKPVPSEDQNFQQALKDVQSAISKVSSDLTFSYDQDFGRTIVKVVDSETDQVIRQIPSEEFIRISKALDRLQGLLIKEEG
jgi:flagellar protein FlaG